MTDYEKMMQMIEEYESSGGDDFAGFKGHIGAMAAGGATPFLGLNQWKRSDKPVMDDFNDDNRKIDDAVRELWEQKANISAPQEFDLPLYSDFTGYIKYSKNAFNMVHIEFSVKANDAAGVSTFTQFAEIPFGFRPRRSMKVPISVRTGILSGNEGYLYVDESGRLIVDTYASGINAREWTGFCCYYTS